MRHLCGIPAGRARSLDALTFWREHLHPDDSELILALQQKLHDGKLKQLSVDYRFMHPTHGEKWIQHLGRVRSRDTSGCSIATYGVLRDVTQQKGVENELVSDRKDNKHLFIKMLKCFLRSEEVYVIAIC